MINPSWHHYLTGRRFEVVFESNKWGFVMGIERGWRKIINHDFVQGREIHPRVKDLQPTTQIFDTRVDFPVPVESCDRFL